MFLSHDLDRQETKVRVSVSKFSGYDLKQYNLLLAQRVRTPASYNSWMDRLTDLVWPEKKKYLQKSSLRTTREKLNLRAGRIPIEIWENKASVVRKGTSRRLPDPVSIE